MNKINILFLFALIVIALFASVDAKKMRSEHKNNMNIATTTTVSDSHDKKHEENKALQGVKKAKIQSTTSAGDSGDKKNEESRKALQDHK